MINVFEGRSAKIPWCTGAGQPCLTSGITQISLYVSRPCAADYCPYSNFAPAAKRSSKGGAFCVASRVRLDPTAGANDTAVIASVNYDVVDQGIDTLVNLDLTVTGDVLRSAVEFGSATARSAWSRFGEVVAERSHGAATMETVLQRLAQERILSPASAHNATDRAHTATICIQL